MNEFDFIKRYLEKSGAFRLQSISYYNEGEQSVIAAKTVHLGVIAGATQGYTYFFGDFEVTVHLTGVIVLTNANSIRTLCSTNLPGFSEVGRFDLSVWIGNGLNLLGNGAYVSRKRAYQIGLNRFDIVKYDCGAATFVYDWNFNGYMFKLR